MYSRPSHASPTSYSGLLSPNSPDSNFSNAPPTFHYGRYSTVPAVGFAVGPDGPIAANAALEDHTMSQSPNDHAITAGGDDKPARKASTASFNDDTRPSAKRRPSAADDDTIDYPRKRASIACQLCRQRKSRCNGNTPCRLCSELKVKCEYRAPKSKLDEGDQAILAELKEIKSLLSSKVLPRSQSAQLTTPSPAASTSTVNDEHVARQAARSVKGGVNGLEELAVDTTPALHLLLWPIIDNIVSLSEKWDSQVLVRLERNRDQLSVRKIRSAPDYSNDAIEAYTQEFFKRVNIWYACVNPYTWKSTLESAKKYPEGPESCLVLLVLALGCASLKNISQCSPNAEKPGYSYFAAAWDLMPALLVRSDIAAAQCQVLAAAYFFYLVRPLEAWNLLANASMKVRLFFNDPERRPAPGMEQLSRRLFWNTLLFESDLLAELELPKSGIEDFQDFVARPEPFKDTGAEQRPGNDVLWYFSANISLRKILNRVSDQLYIPKKSPNSFEKLDATVSELERELSSWFVQLPTQVRFDLGSEKQPTEPEKTVLRLRYNACLTIIFRRYVCAVFVMEHNAKKNKGPAVVLDDSLRKNCKKCLDACLAQLENITAHHAGHLAYLWQGALSIVSQTLLIMGATMCPSLAELLPTPLAITEVIDNVLRDLDHLEHLAPSIRWSVDLIRRADAEWRWKIRNSPSMARMRPAVFGV